MKGVEQIEHTLHNLASPKRGHTFWGLVIVMFVAFLMIWANHGTWLRSPNEVMFAKSSDGLKNYMTTAWFVQHDSGYVHFGGMGYPFGDHVLFTDNQPILCVAIKWWSQHVFDVRGQTIGILHLFLVLSIVFGAGVIYLLFRKLHLPAWYAGIAALGIGFLSPQYNRFDGHFGLSHIWVLPMLLLLLCRYEELQSRRYKSLLIGILIWFSSQLHFYYLGVSAVFLGFYTLFQILRDRSWRNFWTRSSHMIVMIVLPFAALNIWTHWSDYCPDRAAAPYGFTDYIGRWEGVFLPYNFFPMHQWINENITKIRGLDFEAEAYVGLAAFVFTLWLIFKRRFRLFEPEWEQAAYHRVHKNYLLGICFAAFATLVFGFGFPFSIKGLEWMVNYLGPLRQFRGLGRFTWAFYYIINVLMFYILWNKSQRMQMGEQWIAWLKSRSELVARHFPNVAKWGLVLTPLTVLCWEAFYFQKHKALPLMPSVAQHNAVAASPDHWLNKVDFARFQAFMPLPYYHVGSENLWLEVYYPLFKKVQYTALQTGVPDMGVNLSRAAIGRMVKSMQFSLQACEPPELLSELPDNRPIALMIEMSKWEDVQKKYGHLLDKATQVYQNPELKIMALIPDSVRAWSQEQSLLVLAEERQATFNAGRGFRSEKQPGWYTSINFDSITTSEHIFQGKGSGYGNIGDTTWIWNNPMPKGTYEFSIWTKVDEDMGMTQDVKFLEKSRADGHQVYFRKETLRSEIKTIVNNWALYVLQFEVQEDQSALGIFLHKKDADAPFWYDEGMIKDKNFNLYRQEPGWVIRNNYWYKLPKNWPNQR
ncbi:MAG: hypothetical protein ACKVU0_05925 [Saprospiraceae bacterium]